MFDDDLARRIRPLVSRRDDVVEKKMFGGLAFLVGGHMAVAASGRGGLMVRVPPERHDELLAEPGAAPMEMRGRSTPGWLRVEAGAVEDDDELAHWVGIGVDHAGSLPPKE
ncbi:TfoX/Sxy family protein [Cellulomonas edaphi]|uniref:TfoX/Sxy family protein n=1 Tax=Cellulomonas edaphi TaxID=3053468 RepID=A0ABT7S779_9CELL|nr:TfoX/Sxy family protein [Cellulomons edaphi]MDM7830887.1 TfoX/Sxy family protein [Cellulomons edaphi]